MPPSLPALLGLLLLTPALSQQPATFPEQIGSIDFFGYAGLPLQPIREALPIHPGDRIKEADFPKALDQIQTSIQRTTTHPATDIDVVCCDSNQHLLLFIGLQGNSWRPLPTRPNPTGSAHLDPTALKLYTDDLDQVVLAVTSGKASEDDSNGYTLTNFPAAKAIQLKMLDYAATRTAALATILHEAPDAKDRQAAAALLGYAPQSPTQLAALNFACTDPDSDVRNNAIRALAVLASGPHPPPFDPKPLINLLFYGKWSDRNKASFFLAHATQSRDPNVLATLRREALQPLVEGASWSSAGHAYAFLTILARIELIPEPQLQKLDPTLTTTILRAAQTLTP